MEGAFLCYSFDQVKDHYLYERGKEGTSQKWQNLGYMTEEWPLSCPIPAQWGDGGTCPPTSHQGQFSNSSKLNEKMLRLGQGTSSKILK